METVSANDLELKARNQMLKDIIDSVANDRFLQGTQELNAVPEIDSSDLENRLAMADAHASVCNAEAICIELHLLVQQFSRIAEQLKISDGELHDLRITNEVASSILSRIAGNLEYAQKWRAERTISARLSRGIWEVSKSFRRVFRIKDKPIKFQDVGNSEQYGAGNSGKSVTFESVGLCDEKTGRRIDDSEQHGAGKTGDGDGSV